MPDVDVNVRPLVKLAPEPGLLTFVRQELAKHIFSFASGSQTICTNRQFCGIV